MKNRIEYHLYLGRNEGDRPIDTARLKVFFSVTGPWLAQGYTLINALGCWEGEVEDSIILVYIGKDTDRGIVRKVGAAYKAWFNQQAVLMTEQPVVLEMI